MSQGRLLPRSAPAVERINAKGVLALLDRLDERSVECHSLMVARHGSVVAEGWWAPYSPDRAQLLLLSDQVVHLDCGRRRGS